MTDQRKTKKQLLEELERERERSTALQEVSNKVAAAHDTDEVLGLIVNEAARLVGAPWAFVALVEEGKLTPRAYTENAADYLAEIVEAQPMLNIETGTSAMGHMLATRTPHVYEDTQEDELATAAGRVLAKKYGMHGGVLVPLLANDMPIGALAIMDKRIRRFTEDEVCVLMAFADQASLALDKARLLNEAEREKERSDAHYRVSNLLAGAHDTDEVLDRIVNEAARLVGATAAWIRLLEGDSLVLAGAATESVAGFLAENAESRPAIAVEEQATVMAKTVATKKPIVVEDASEDLSIEEVRLRVQKYGFHGFAVIPLLANDRSIGVLNVMDKRIRRFTDDEVSLLSAFADQASLALEKARLLNEAEREKERSDALYRVSNLLTGAHETDEVLDLVVNEYAWLLNATAGYLRLLEGDLLVPSAATESAAAFLTKMDEFSPANPVGKEGGAAGYVLATKKPLVSMDIEEGQFTRTGGFLAAKEMGLEEYVAVPLIANEKAIGVLLVLDSQARRFTEDEVTLLSAFADQAALALEKARLLNEAEREKNAPTAFSK
jgi:GAF domain-containing protein